MKINVDLAKFSKSIEALIEAVDEGTRLGVVDAISLVEREAKRNFAGQISIGQARPPGGDRPWAHSEALKRSITRFPTVPMQIGVGQYEQKLAPTMVYARRVELGFVGRDSLNRLYNQPPYPYMKPAHERALPQLLGIFKSHWSRAIRGNQHG